MNMNRAQRREAEKQSRNLKIDSLPSLRETSTLKPVSSPWSNNLPPMTTTEENLAQKTGPLPPTGNPIFPLDQPTSGTDALGNNKEEEHGLQPLSKKELKLAEDLAQVYFLLGTVSNYFSPFAATIIILQSNELAENNVRMARHIKGYYQFLEKMVTWTDYTPFIMSHLQTIAVIMAHHDLVKGPAKEHFNQIGASILARVGMNGTGIPTDVPIMAQ